MIMVQGDGANRLNHKKISSRLKNFLVRPEQQPLCSDSTARIRTISRLDYQMVLAQMHLKNYLLLQMNSSPGYWRDGRRRVDEETKMMDRCKVCEMFR